MDKNEILYDHYKETVKLNHDMARKRGALFVAAVLLELLNLALLLFPTIVMDSLSLYVDSQYQFKLDLSVNILQSTIWIAITYILVRYFQSNIYIERQYSYISKIEEQLAASLNEPLLKRESDSYLDNYPTVLNIIDFFYKWIVPILFIAINVFKIGNEVFCQGLNAGVAFDCVLCAGIVILIIFYLKMMHTQANTGSDPK